MRRLPLQIAALLLLLVPAAGAGTLRVLTFNVRYPSTNDGDNRWEFRRDIMVRTIRATRADIVGTQELFFVQGQYIAEKAPEYTWFGTSRRGTHADEHMGIFYRKDKLRLLDSGNFWLSETPEVPGSMSWGVNLPRMVTWGLFEITPGGKRFYLYNTHFPHRREDQPARLHAARVLLDRIARLPESASFILTGDFNSPAGGEVYQLFTGKLKDAWQAAAKRVGPESTSGGFSGSTKGARIDWILYRGPFKLKKAETVTRNEQGRYPSDHFPVLAVFEQ